MKEIKEQKAKKILDKSIDYKTLFWIFVILLVLATFKIGFLQSKVKQIDNSLILPKITQGIFYPTNQSHSAIVVFDLKDDAQRYVVEQTDNYFNNKKGGAYICRKS
jgi:hypothetical protein